MEAEQKYHGKTIEYWKENAEEDYIKAPISVLKYITILEEALSEVAPKQEQEENELSRVVGEFLKKESSERGVSMDDLYLCFDEYQNEVDIYYDVEGDNKLRYIDSKK